LPSAEEFYESAMNHLNNGDRVTAAVQLSEACLLKPDYSQAFNNRGNVLLQLGNCFDAVLNYERAISILDAPEYHNNKGAALAELNRWEDAEASYRAAIERKPKFEHALTNLGNVLKLLDRLPEARRSYEEAIEANAQYVDAHLNLSFIALEQGDFRVGWQEYEWRWRSNQLPERGLPFAQWRGTKLRDDQGLLLYSEQGMGDALQFCRYATMVKKKFGGKVYVEVRSPLARLMRTLEGIDGVVALGEKLPDGITFCAPLLTCPLIFGTTVDTIPAPQTYLSADPYRVSLFAKELAKLPPSLKVGLCWAGERRVNNPGAAAIDKRRSTSLQSLAALATPGVTWVSLQKGPPAAQLHNPPPGMMILDCMDDCDDFFDTAALIAGLDLVICVDTSVAHLAAALGKPTWILSRKDSCWRWLGARKDSPWYPTVTHYRQEAQGDWAGLARIVGDDLRKWAQTARIAA
jgi:tetratricopeptide (TPR) repeat protein